MKLQQTFRPLLSKLSKRRQIKVLYAHFEEVMGGIEPWLMARWKAGVEFLLSVIELLFLSLTVEALQGKMCQNSLPSEGGRSLAAKISGGRGRPWGIFFMVSTKLDTFVQRAQCSHCKRCISYSNSVRLSVRPSVSLSVCTSDTRRYCVKTSARSTVQFAPLDSKMCLVL